MEVVDSEGIYFIAYCEFSCINKTVNQHFWFVHSVNAHTDLTIDFAAPQAFTHSSLPVKMDEIFAQMSTMTQKQEELEQKPQAPLEECAEIERRLIEVRAAQEAALKEHDAVKALTLKVRTGRA